MEGDNLHNAQLKIFNSNGQHVFSHTLKSGNNIIARPSQIPAGVYVYYVYSNGKAIKTGKLVLK